MYTPTPTCALPLNVPSATSGLAGLSGCKCGGKCGMGDTSNPLSGLFDSASLPLIALIGLGTVGFITTAGSAQRTAGRAKSRVKRTAKSAKSGFSSIATLVTLGVAGYVGYQIYQSMQGGN